jgi:hypothetical protein
VNQAGSPHIAGSSGRHHLDLDEAQDVALITSAFVVIMPWGKPG